ncbi:MAG: GNAT family N-acetyltransferase [Paracoccaceae bacterium]
MSEGFAIVAPEEADALVPLLVALAGGPWTPGDVRRLCPPVGFALADAERGAALALVQTAGPEADLLDLGVVPDRRRTGLGTALLAAVEREAAARGAQRLILEVSVENGAALALYAARSYAQIGRRAHYYVRPDGSRIDALMLARDLPPRPLAEASAAH